MFGLNIEVDFRGDTGTIENVDSNDDGEGGRR
jgi:hypothetical protein